MGQQNRDEETKKGLWSSLKKPFKKSDDNKRSELPWGSNYVPAEPYQPHSPKRASGASPSPASSRAPYRPRGVIPDRVVFPPAGYGYDPNPPQPSPQDSSQNRFGVSIERPQYPPQNPLQSGAQDNSQRRRPPPNPNGSTQLPEVQAWVRSYTRRPQHLTQSSSRGNSPTNPDGSIKLLEYKGWVRSSAEQPPRYVQKASGSRAEDDEANPLLGDAANPLSDDAANPFSDDAADPFGDDQEDTSAELVDWVHEEEKRQNLRS